ncbi:hypothetical protein D0962_00520 [Leptolyngbyaceae cyanobacterium CCMR0082]|uniref:Uncharacterized protein n=2 Tax=Adonisia turfae TaxID=2950184 RepID=A0A6M0RYH8_9CYAN|nr:hypothetical protein [Adonisia turfae]MDV3349749.1 hypothetical protein [Leptothoe sp. LEGE 181152]NEZ57464.1 hypothetical protein [Adonisia turfae CCMR0081]NEZ61268.1 hypothetical protein [Adonisia turfae CCMR0082]
MLSEKIQDAAIRASIADDCAKLIDKQVAAKGGLTGMAMKTAYGVIKGVGAGYIPGAINRLLPDACKALEPIWQEGAAAGDPVKYLSENSDRTADSILSVTDARIQNTSNGVVSGTYKKLRKSVKNDVEAAVPDLAQIIYSHAA